MRSGSYAPSGAALSGGGLRGGGGDSEAAQLRRTAGPRLARSVRWLARRRPRRMRKRRRADDGRHEAGRRLAEGARMVAWGSGGVKWRHARTTR